MKKTSKKDFNTFKREFNKWQKLFGCQHWDIEFHHVILKGKEDVQAEIVCDPESCTASCYYNLEKTDGGVPAETVGKQEAIHMLLSMFFNLADRRYLNKEQLDDEEEKLVMKLEKLIV